jgi:hypothetical protein
MSNQGGVDRAPIVVAMASASMMTRILELPRFSKDKQGTAYRFKYLSVWNEQMAVVRWHTVPARTIPFAAIIFGLRFNTKLRAIQYFIKLIQHCTVAFRGQYEAFAGDSSYPTTNQIAFLFDGFVAHLDRLWLQAL